MDKIICVGKNYLEHAEELGDAVPAKPVLFLKPPSVLKEAKNGETISVEFPENQGEVHHECEIVLRLKKGGYRLSLDQAEQCIGDFSVGLDMTLRSKQALLKKAGSPWTISKVFPSAAIVGPWVPKSEFDDYLKTDFSIEVNGTLKQVGQGVQMTFNPAQCISYISEHFALCAEDLIFTGTPKGVGPILKGDLAQLKMGSISYKVRWNV